MGERDAAEQHQGDGDDGKDEGKGEGVADLGIDNEVGNIPEADELVDPQQKAINLAGCTRRSRRWDFELVTLENGNQIEGITDNPPIAYECLFFR